MTSGGVLVAELDDELVGFAAHDRSFFDRAFVQIPLVDPNHRRRGIGSALLRQTVETFANERVFTSTNASNLPMLTLLHHLSWTKAGTVSGLDEGNPEVFYFTDPH